ncbi:hypothetical protein FRD01_10500 [Microvenator marinus]|uniref:Uncharacterized protein n=1 Tax=Microvenator marinus TaxID=2600177 RepID=A0A5B8XV96_9DELT|nr:hypothetical protein [Microvenator marinus]QED27656.1 hypothetical protein FRD01_10500 [Microvenator marinus]
MASIENLEKLVQDCTNPSLDDDQSFQDVLLVAQEILVIDDDRCAELFDVSRSSVNRWRNGATAPRRVVRRHVYSVLLNEAQRALKSKSKRVADARAGSSSEYTTRR